MPEIPIKPTQMPMVELIPTEASGVSTKKEKALVEAGATREIAYKTMVSALEAESMTVDKFGDEHMTPDHSTRIRAAELISKLNGDLKDAPTVDNRVVNITITPSDLETFTSIVAGVKEEIRGLRDSGRQTGEIIDVTL